MQSPSLTVGEVANLFGARDWQVRRVVDALAPELPRAGQYRLIPRPLLGKIAVEMERRGFLPSEEVVTCEP